MTKISPPPGDASSLDYHLDCQLAIEPSFLELCDSAERAGWPKHILAYALVDLALSYIELEENTEEKKLQLFEAITARVKI